MAWPGAAGVEANGVARRGQHGKRRWHDGRGQHDQRGWHDERGHERGLWGNARRQTWLKALVWFWLIDETLSANLVYQSDYEIGSTTSSNEAMMKIMMIVKAW